MSKWCAHCGGRVVKDGECAPEYRRRAVETVNCNTGDGDWFDTEGITRGRITRYLIDHGWKLQSSESFTTNISEIWSKKGYPYSVFARWWKRAESPSSRAAQEEDFVRVIRRVADAEGRRLDAVAADIKVMEV